MVLAAVAAILFQFSPVHALPAADLGSTLPVVKTAAASDTKPKPASASTASTTSATADSANGGAAFTLASLESASKDAQPLSTVRVPDPAPAKPIKIILPETHPRRAWLVLSIAEHSAATFDAYSTRAAVSKGASESDPLMRPFAHSPAIYGAIQVCPLVLDFAARRMERSRNNFLRHTWWVPQTAATGVFLFSGAHNLNVANSIHR